MPGFCCVVGMISCRFDTRTYLKQTVSVCGCHQCCHRHGSGPSDIEVVSGIAPKRISGCGGCNVRRIYSENRFRPEQTSREPGLLRPWPGTVVTFSDLFILEAEREIRMRSAGYQPKLGAEYHSGQI